MPDSTTKAPELVFLADLDGSLVDLDGAMHAQLSLLMSPGEDMPKNGPGEGEDLPWIKARRDLIKKQPGFWRNLAPIQEGFRIVRLAESLGFRAVVLTKGPFNTTSAWTEKVEWCRKHLGNVPVIVSEDKGLVYGRVLFDDWPPYITRWLEWRPRGLVVMLSHPWNEGFQHPNVFRFNQGLTGEAEATQMAALRERLQAARDR